MKVLMLIALSLLPALFACNSHGNKDRPAYIDDSIEEIGNRTDADLDTFFYSNLLHKQIGERNGLEMFKTIDADSALYIVGKPVDEIKFRIGEGINELLRDNIEGLDTLNFERIKLVDWSTDLRGDDSKVFLFINNKLNDVEE